MNGSARLVYQDSKSLVHVQQAVRWSEEILLRIKCYVQSSQGVRESKHYGSSHTHWPSQLSEVGGQSQPAACVCK